MSSEKSQPRAIPPPRKIPLASLGVSLVMCVAAALPAYGVYRYFAPGRFVVGGVLAVAAFTIVLLIFCRAFLGFYPLPIGEIIPNSRGEFSFCVYMVVIILTSPVIHFSLVPFPLRRFFYSLLGAKIGHNTYFSGSVYDPPLVQIGDNVMVGAEAILVSHAFTRYSYVLAPIIIGNDVTIGMRAVVMAGVEIGDGAIVAAAPWSRKARALVQEKSGAAFLPGF